MADPRVSELDRVSAWALTRALSKRPNVRTAAQMANGEILNDYDRERPVTDADTPSTPWAMYLTDDTRNYRYLCFDFDSSRGNAPYDAGRLSYWLNELNIPHLTCTSGPTGGRHIWIGLADAATPDLVRNTALVAAQLLPSLDPTPLSNPATGCVRPPGSPHRLGGSSIPHGPTSVLTTPTTPATAVSDLMNFLIDAGADRPAPDLHPLRNTGTDPDGHPYVTGPKRPLSARVAAMVTAPPSDDASYTLAAVLAGCAHSRWHFADILTLADSPAFEHIRTIRARTGRNRILRTERNRLRTLTAAWTRAVRYVASHPLNGSGDDTDYLTRMSTVLTAVEHAQQRADTMPGLWGADRASTAARHTGGTHSTRAVLDALCLYMAQAGQLIVEADIRRLSAETGYGRTTVHTALLTLTRPGIDGEPETAWLIKVGEPEHPHGQRYRLSQRFSTEEDQLNRTQVHARPAALPRLNNAYWITRLTDQLHTLTHDVFAAPHSLGRTAGIVFKYLSPDGSTNVNELVRSTGLASGEVRRQLQRLSFHNLAHRRDTEWTRAIQASLHTVSVALDVDGYLEQRRVRYGTERGRWEWWNAELTWMRKTNKKRRTRRLPTAVALFTQDDRPNYSRYPRGPNGRADHIHALQLVIAGALTPAAALNAA